MHRIITDYTNIETSSNIKVYVRARPPEDNSASMEFLDWRSDPEHKRIVIKDPDVNNKKYSEVAFQFDRVFWTDTQQQDIFNVVCRPQIENVLRGCNACCFAYGQTGSGKTYSMFGEDEEYRGIIPRSVEYIFSALATQDANIEYRLSCSFLEIYNDAIRDLGKVYLVACGLVDGSAGNTTEKTSDLFNSINKKRTDSYFAPAFKRQLSNINAVPSPQVDEILNRPGIRAVQEEYHSMHYDIREDSEGNVFVKDLSNINISTIQEIMTVIELGLKIRATHETKMNNTSSRSHTVFSIIITQSDKSTGTTISGRLNLVDLAGSERLKKSESQGARLKEALHINTSLTALGKVIMALESTGTAVEKVHIPYRDSKLTRILQNSLGGNSYTVLLAAIHPCHSYYDECLSTLQFANRCRNVTNNPRVNYIGTGTELEDKDKKIKRLTDEIQLLRSKLAQFERSGGSGLTGLILAEKIQSVLSKMGMAATIGADGSLKTADGNVISLDDLNAMAVLDTTRDSQEQLRDLAQLSRESKMSKEKLQLVITELEQENNELKSKYKSKKAQLEKTNKELEELSSEYSRSKQSWQHKEYELQLQVKERIGTTKGMEQVLNIKHQEAYRELIQKNQEILSQQINYLTTLPSQMTSLTQTTKRNEMYKEEVMKSYRVASEKVIQEMEQSRQLELTNQKQQYEYWLNKKEEMLIQMTTGFNNYRQKKSNQLKKCELEIIKLFQYVESLENILRKAENGEYYTQRIHVAQEERRGGVGTGTGGAGTAHGATGGTGGAGTGGAGTGGAGVVIGGGGTTLIIPKGTIPTRPTIERKGELELSRKILRKFYENKKKDAKAQSEAVDALLGHCGMKGDDYANNSQQNAADLTDQELENHIRGLITSPSMGRDLIVTASSQLNGPHVVKSSTEKRHSLFNPIPTLPPPSNQGPRSKQLSASNNANVTANANAAAATTKPTTAQGTPARTVQALNKLSNNLKNIPSEEENFFLDDQDGISNYQFPSHTDPSYNQIVSSIYQAGDAMICSPSSNSRQQQSREPMSTFPGARNLISGGGGGGGGGLGLGGSSATPYQTLKTEEFEELFILREENQLLKEKLTQFEQLEREKILETVEGNETIEYIRQLEQESQALRENIQSTTAQLQRSKVVNSSLQRQYDTLKSKVQRPTTTTAKGQRPISAGIKNSN